MVSTSVVAMALIKKDSNYIIIRYLDSGFFLEKDGTAPTEWRKTAAETTAKFGYDVKHYWDSIG